VANPPKAGFWFDLSLTTLQGVANASFNGAPLFINMPIEAADTGFAGISTTGYYAVEVDNVQVLPVGPFWNPNPPVPAGCQNPAIGR
jgi:hypothetical protein